MDLNKHLIELAQAYSCASNLAPTTVAKKAAGDARLFANLVAGCSITTRRAAKVLQWFSDNWPDGLAWPLDIPRPDPAPGSPAAAESESAAVDHEAEVVTLTEFKLESARRLHAFAELHQSIMQRAAQRERVPPADHARLRDLGADLMDHAGTLDGDGHIISHASFLQGLGAVHGKILSPQLLTDAIKKLERDPAWIPRMGSKSRLICDALKFAGDVRFMKFGEAGAVIDSLRRAS